MEASKKEKYIKILLTYFLEHNLKYFKASYYKRIFKTEPSWGEKVYLTKYLAAEGVLEHFRAKHHPVYTINLDRARELLKKFK